MATVKELKAQAKAKGIKGYSKMKKAELEKALGGGGAKPPPKPPRTKTKAQQAMNPVKQVQPPKIKKIPKKTEVIPKKKIIVKKAPAATTKDSADMKFIKNMKNTVKDIKRLYSIFRKYGNAIPKLKWKNFSASSKFVEFDAPHGYAFNLEKIAERVREGRDLKGKGMLDANDWFNVFAGFKPTHGTFSFEKLLANKAPVEEKPKPAAAAAAAAPAKTATLGAMRKELKDKGVKGTASMGKYELETRLAPRKPSLLKKYSDTAFMNLKEFYNDADDDFPKELLKKNESLLNDVRLFLYARGMNADLAHNRGKAFNDVYKEKTMELIQKLDKAFKIDIAKGKTEFIG